MSGETHDGRVLLAYRWRVREDEWEAVHQWIPITWTPCNYGGQRPWWLCPGCARRVAIVYGPGRLFLCRHCHRLAYPSTRENLSDRLLRKAWKIVDRLGDGDLDRLPRKPKHMHWATYRRLCRKAAEADHESWLALGARFLPR